LSGFNAAPPSIIRLGGVVRFGGLTPIKIGPLVGPSAPFASHQEVGTVRIFDPSVVISERTVLIC
jgi:hypothetical protein